MTKINANLTATIKTKKEKSILMKYNKDIYILVI